MALFDAEAVVDAGVFAGVAGEAAGARRWWAVRLDAGVACRALRARLAAWPVEGDRRGGGAGDGIRMICRRRRGRCGCCGWRAICGRGWRWMWCWGRR
ncbi:MAG: hypothetical protein R3F65_09165 [bacterium]